ncbi:MAG TPA: T9SS type A sorting domain-containing protein [Terriglobales bacterium]|nr:T9SS type A sorting domain-containing protein [Terriglobales bacterium]
MPHSLRRPKFSCVAGALVLAAALPLSARAASEARPTGAPAPVSSFAPMMKRTQREALLREPAERREMILERARVCARAHARAHLRGKRAAEKLREPIDLNEAGGPQGVGPNRSSASRVARRAALSAALEPNVRVNDRSQDASSNPPIGQAEQMVAALGPNVLVAFNDGAGFATTPESSTQGYSYSTDSGATFTDGGAPPILPGWRWSSDPVVTVNEKTGEFWFCALVDVGTTDNGVGVVKATFSGGAPTWGTPVLAASISNSAGTADKPWMVVDSLSGRLYLSYTLFTLGPASDHIAFQRSAPGGGSWEAAQTLSAPAEAGAVQGSRPAVGPNGEVYVVWNSIGTIDVDFMRIVKSTSQGAAGSWSASVDAASEFSNFSSGAPGFNRGIGITFPGIAVDRSSGPHRGRVYVSWNESIDFYNDPLGTGALVNEVEPANNLQSTPTPFTLGDQLTGNVASKDIDFFRFNGTAGQTVIFFTDSVGPGLDLLLRLVAADTTRLALSALGQGAKDLVVYTLPQTGQYFVRLTGNQGVSTGFYRISTGVHTPIGRDRARDHRDIFVAWSDDAVHWSTPARASDSPAGYDDWLPEVAVAGSGSDPRVVGEPYCLWYDWRDSPAASCGGVSHVYLSRSDDGGTSWTKVGVVTDQQTFWTNTPSNIAPNEGDYVFLFANASNLYASWADGRNGDPDVFLSRIPLVTTAVDLALVSAQATPDSVTLTWFSGLPLGTFTVSVQRGTNGVDFVDLGPPTPVNGSSLVYVDHDVSPGASYYYRLEYTPQGAPTVLHTPPTLVVVPARALVLLGARPNPANEKKGWVVAFELGDPSPGKIELFDVSGRRIEERIVSGLGPQTVDLSAGSSLKPGLYVIRLSQSGRDVTKRVTIVR